MRSSIFSVARGNKGGKAAFNGDRKRKRDEKGEHDDMTSEMDAIQELCKQLTSERADRGELIVALKAVAAIGCKPLWTELRQRGVVSSSDTHSRTLLSCVNMAEKLVSILLAFELKQSAAGQLCMVAGAGALVALLSLKFRHSQGEDVHETRLEPTSSRLLCNSISLLTREMQQVEMVGKRPLLHQKGLLSAFRDFLSVIMGPETVLDVVDRVRCLCQVLFTSTLIRFDGKPHYKAKTLKKLGALLISCRTSPVDGLLVTACAEACLSAVFKREQNKTDSFTEFIESVVNAIDMTLPTSLALRMEDNRMRSEEVPGTCYYNYHSYSYLSLAMAAGCVLQLRCALPLPSSPAVTRLPQDFKSVAETMCLLMSNGKKDLGSIGVLRQALAYVHGVCVITACMKPSASSHHFGSILCLLILFLHWLGHAMDPVPKLIPLTSIFPAASGEQTPGSVSELRGKALLAVHALISGASNQRVREVIRYAQNLLGGRCSGLNCLVASELLLMMLEAHGLCREHEHEHGMFNVQKDSVESTSSRNFNHALAQYGDRMACTLIRTLSVTSWAPLRGSPSEPDGEDSSEVNMNIRMGGVSYWQLCREYLKSTAHDIKSGADGGPCAGRLEWARAQVTPAPGWVVPVVPTTLRALESIVGRPKVFTNIPSRTFGRLVQCLSYTLPTGEFNHESGSVFVAICRLVLSLLRHREEAISPSMSEVARILGALLRWLIPNLCDSATSKNTVLLNDCSEVLGSVVVAFGSRGQSTAALCPNVLREYLLAQTRGNIQVLETSAIRYGAYALYGGSGAGGVEYLYATLGGHAAFQALAEVKAGYEAEYKYTGKV